MQGVVLNLQPSLDHHGSRRSKQLLLLLHFYMMILNKIYMFPKCTKKCPSIDKLAQFFLLDKQFLSLRNDLVYIREKGIL